MIMMESDKGLWYSNCLNCYGYDYDGVRQGALIF
jgi:hypothetical protein